jgi:hypothetical protein
MQKYAKMYLSEQERKQLVFCNIQIMILQFNFIK